jgi:hypothetical protein
VPFLAYVHARQPDEPEGEARTPWEPNWRVWRWVAVALVVAYGAGRANGALAYLLVLVVFGLCCRAVQEWLPSGDGLREWRQ